MTGISGYLAPDVHEAISRDYDLSATAARGGPDATPVADARQGDPPHEVPHDAVGAARAYVQGAKDWVVVAV